MRAPNRTPATIGASLAIVAALLAFVLILIRHPGSRQRSGAGGVGGSVTSQPLNVERVLRDCGLEIVSSLPWPPEPSPTPRITSEGVRIIERALAEGRTSTLADLLGGIEITVETQERQVMLEPSQLGEALLAAARELSKDDDPLSCAVRQLALVPGTSDLRSSFDDASSASALQGVLLQVVLLGVTDRVNGQSLVASGGERDRFRFLARWFEPGVAYAAYSYPERARQILRQKMAVAAAGALGGVVCVGVSIVCPAVAPAALTALGTIYVTVGATNAALDLQLAMEYRYAQEYGMQEIAEQVRREEGALSPRATKDLPVAVIRARAGDATAVSGSDQPHAAGYLEGAAPLVVHFGGSSSYAAPGHRIVDYTWRFPGSIVGDKREQIVHGADAERTFSWPGSASVTLTVTDEAGRSAMTSVIIHTERPAAQVPPPRTTTLKHWDDPSVQGSAWSDLVRRAWPGALVEEINIGNRGGCWSVRLPSGLRFHVGITFVPDPGQESLPYVDKRGHMEMGYGVDESSLTWVRLR